MFRQEAVDDRTERECGGCMERGLRFGARGPLDARRPREPIFGRVGVSRETPTGRAGPALTLALAGLDGSRSVAYRAASPAPGQRA